MRRTGVLCAFGLLLLGPAMLPAQMMDVPRPAAPKAPYYIDPALLDLAPLVPAPPAIDSAAEKQELGELHRIEKSRTAEQVTAAKADADEEDMFAFKSVLGPTFNPQALPLTAAFGMHVKNEQSVAGAMLKPFFKRPRPYQVDSTLHPVCETTTVPNSYPSGHALTGYLEALTLIEIVPEKRSELMARADDYAHNRLVCGVHYPSDIEESRRVAYVVFGYMMATPRFQRDLATAPMETRAKLGLAPLE